MSDEDRRRTAYHEGGHAIVGMLTPGADPVRKVSIIPRGMALGVTFSAPDADRFNYLEPEIRTKIKVALGGRVDEETVFGEVSTGAESDLEQLTGLARQMVGRWGMSDALGPVSVIPRDGSGPFLSGVAEVSPETQKLLDDEVRRIVAEAHDEVVTLLTENRRAARRASRVHCSSARRWTRTTPTRLPASRDPRLRRPESCAAAARSRT